MKLNLDQDLDPSEYYGKQKIFHPEIWKLNIQTDLLDSIES